MEIPPYFSTHVSPRQRASVYIPVREGKTRNLIKISWKSLQICVGSRFCDIILATKGKWDISLKFHGKPSKLRTCELSTNNFISYLSFWRLAMQYPFFVSTSFMRILTSFSPWIHGNPPNLQWTKKSRRSYKPSLSPSLDYRLTLLIPLKSIWDVYHTINAHTV